MHAHTALPILAEICRGVSCGKAAVVGNVAIRLCWICWLYLMVILSVGDYPVMIVESRRRRQRKNRCRFSSNCGGVWKSCAVESALVSWRFGSRGRCRADDLQCGVRTDERHASSTRKKLADEANTLQSAIGQRTHYTFTSRTHTSTSYS